MVEYAACPRQTGIIWLERKSKKWQNALIVVSPLLLVTAVSFSKRATNRPFHPNLQKVTVIENGQKVQKILCTKCIRTLAKTA